MRTQVQNYFIRFIEQMSERKFLLLWFTKIIDFPEVNDTFNNNTMEVELDKFRPTLPGEIYQKTSGNDKELYVVTETEIINPQINNLVSVSLAGPVSDKLLLKMEFLGKNLETPLIKINNNIELFPNEIKNFKGNSSIITSPGMILLNQRLFVESFDDAVPYWETEIKVGMLDDLLAKLLLDDKINVDQAHRFLTNCYDIGFFGELCNRGFTSKSFTTHPDMKKRKQELLSKLSDEQKKDPLVLAKVEEELLKLDREWLKGDDADMLHSALGSKSYDIHRKKMYITVGAIPAFSDKGDVEFNLIENSLDDGWDKNNFDTIVNEIYKGSYNRGAETAKGGELTKYVLRVYQDLGISDKDCGSTKGAKIELINNTKSKTVTSLIGRYLMDGRIVSQEILDANAGKVIEIRDPLFCKSPAGICYKCMGWNFERIEEVDIGSYILDISSGIMMISMKNMHGTKLTTFDINFYDFLITI